MENKMNSKYLTYAEVEEIYGIKKTTLYSWVFRKEIPHVRLSSRYVLFPREEIERIFTNQLIQSVTKKIKE